MINKISDIKRANLVMTLEEKGLEAQKSTQFSCLSLTCYINVIISSYINVIISTYILSVVYMYNAYVICL